MAGSELFTSPYYANKLRTKDIVDYDLDLNVLERSFEENITEIGGISQRVTPSPVNCQCHKHRGDHSLFQKASGIADQALSFDHKGDYKQAIRLYDEAVELFLEALQTESNSTSTTTIICVRCEKCLARARQLRNAHIVNMSDSHINNTSSIETTDSVDASAYNDRRSRQLTRFEESRFDSFKRRSRSLFQNRRGKLQIRSASLSNKMSNNNDTTDSLSNNQKKNTKAMDGDLLQLLWERVKVSEKLDDEAYPKDE